MACGCGTYTPTGPCSINAIVCKGYYVDITPTYSATSVNQGIHGTVTLLSNGNIRYEHNGINTASDSFIYNYLGGNCTVNITVEDAIPENTTVIILTASADCEVGTPTYTWNIPECASLAEGFTIHDQIVHVIVPVYDPENPDATCEITVDVCCDFCIGCCKCETFTWSPPNCTYPCGEDPICDCTELCEVYNPLTGNCEGCPDGTICCGTAGSRPTIAVGDLTVECEATVVENVVTDIHWVITPELSGIDILRTRYHIVDIEGTCGPELMDDCIDYRNCPDKLILDIDNTIDEFPGFQAFRWIGGELFFEVDLTWLETHTTTKLVFTLEAPSGCGTSYKSFLIDIDIDSWETDCGFTISTGDLGELGTLCDVTEQGCKGVDNTYCAECCNTLDCPSGQVCVEGTCQCPEGFTETTLGYCCPTTLPDCAICNDLGIIISNTGTECETPEEVFNYETCECECAEDYCLDLLTGNCVDCPPCTPNKGRYKKKTAEGLTAYQDECPSCKQCVACTNEPGCTSGFMCITTSCAAKAMCQGNEVDQVPNPNPTVSYTDLCTGLEIHCSEENPCCCMKSPCDVVTIPEIITGRDNDMTIQITTTPCNITSATFRAFINGVDVDNVPGTPAWYVNTTNYTEDWVSVAANGNGTVTIPFATYAFGFLIKCEMNGRIRVMEYFNDGCNDVMFREVYSNCIYIVSIDGDITNITNQCGNESVATEINGEIVITNVSSTLADCLCVSFTQDPIDEITCTERTGCITPPVCEGPCDEPLSVLLEAFINSSGHYVYHASVYTPNFPLMYTCAPPDRTEWLAAGLGGQLSSGKRATYLSTPQDGCGTFPNDGFTGCVAGSTFNCNPDNDLPEPTKPCGWLVLGNGTTVYDLNGSNIEIGITAGQTATVCFGVNTECGYVCNCETITPPEEPCENFDADLTYDCDTVGNKSAGISASNGFGPYSWILTYAVNGITYTATGDNWDGVGISVNLNTTGYISQISLEVTDSLGCTASDAIICPPENCDLDVVANAVCQENETTLITYTITGNNQNGYVVNISSPCTFGPTNKFAGTHTYSCSGWQTLPITISVHELGPIEPCFDSVTITPTGDCGITPPPTSPCDDITVDGSIDTGGDPIEGRYIYIPAWDNGNSI